MEQFDLFHQKTTDSMSASETVYYNEIYPFLGRIKDERNISMDDIQFKKCKGYCSISFKTFLAFKLKIGGKKSYIAVPTGIMKELPPDNSYYQIPSDHRFTRMPLDSEHLTPKQLQNIYQIMLSTIDRCQKEFDCCSRFNECSDARKCIHPNHKFAIGCGYRKILESGTVFYGKNRNVE